MSKYYNNDDSRLFPDRNHRQYRILRLLKLLRFDIYYSVLKMKPIIKVNI